MCFGDYLCDFFFEQFYLSHCTKLFTNNQYHQARYELRWPSGKIVRLGSCRLGFNSKAGQINDFKIGVHDSVKNKPASLLVKPLGKALSGIPPSW